MLLPYKSWVHFSGGSEATFVQRGEQTGSWQAPYILGRLGRYDVHLLRPQTQQMYKFTLGLP